MDSKLKKILFNFFKLASSVTLLLLVIRKTNLTEVLQALSTANIYYLVAALLVYSLSYYLRTFRWQSLLKARGIPASNLYLLKSYFVGIFFSNFLPSIVGGDAIRVYDIWRIEPNKSIAVTTVLVDRVLGLLVLAMFALGGLFVVPQAQSLISFSGISLAIAIISITLVCLIIRKLLVSKQVREWEKNLKFGLWQKIRLKVFNIWQALMSFKDAQKQLLAAVFWSISVQVAVILHYFLIAKSLSFSTSLASFFLIVPLATVIMMLPISINAIGLRENAFVFLIGTYSIGVTRPETIAFSWLAYGIIVIQGLVGGLVHLLRK